MTLHLPIWYFLNGFTNSPTMCLFVELHYIAFTQFLKFCEWLANPLNFFMFVELALNSPNLYFIYEWLENSLNFVFFETKDYYTHPIPCLNFVSLWKFYF
jgi:hypothetical protein